MSAEETLPIAPLLRPAIARASAILSLSLLLLSRP
jgi:hypothetical protein